MEERMSDMEIKGWQNWLRTKIDYPLEDWKENNR